jgi:hypothetical protein
MKVFIAAIILFSSAAFSQSLPLSRNIFKSFTLQSPVALEKPISIVRNGEPATWTNLRNTIFGKGIWVNERQYSGGGKCMMHIYGLKTQTLPPGSVFMVANMQINLSFNPKWLNINLQGSNVPNVSMNIYCIETGSLNVGWNRVQEYFTGIGQFTLNQ